MSSIMDKNHSARVRSTLTMRLTRSIRSFAAILALLGVLLGQLGIAAHACPMTAGSGDCCVSMDPGEPALCQAHCQQDDQSSSLPTVHALPPALAVERVIAPTAAVTPPPDPHSLLARPTAPCAAVRHCRFLI
jgi:hypothetical protein